MASAFQSDPSVTIVSTEWSVETADAKPAVVDYYKVMDGPSDSVAVQEFMDGLRPASLRHRSSPPPKNATLVIPRLHLGAPPFGVKLSDHHDFPPAMFVSQDPLVKDSIRKMEVFLDRTLPKTFGDALTSLEEAAHLPLGPMQEWITRASQNTAVFVNNFAISPDFLTVYQSAQIVSTSAVFAERSKKKRSLTVHSLLALAVDAVEDTEEVATALIDEVEEEEEVSLGTRVVHVAELSQTKFLPLLGKTGISDLVFAVEQEEMPHAAIRLYDPNGTAKQRSSSPAGNGTVQQLLESGGSMIVQFEHAVALAKEHLPLLEAMQRAVEDALRTSVSAHLYVKGPQQQQQQQEQNGSALVGGEDQATGSAIGGSALPMHVDPTDVLVFQLAGCNRWSHCVPPTSATNTTNDDTVHLSDSERSEQLLIQLGGRSASGGGGVGGVNGVNSQGGLPSGFSQCADLVTQAGDALYIPRAVYHKAVSTTECQQQGHDGDNGGGGAQRQQLEALGLPAGSSMHLTIGVQRKDAEWVEVLKAAMELLLFPPQGKSQSEKKEEKGELLGSVLVQMATTSVLTWRRQTPTWILNVNPEDSFGEWNEKVDALAAAFEQSQRSSSSVGGGGGGSFSGAAKQRRLVLLQHLQQLRNPKVFHAAVLVWQQRRAATASRLRKLHQSQQEAKFSSSSFSSGAARARAGAGPLSSSYRRPQGRRLECSSGSYSCPSGQYSGSGVYYGWDCNEGCDDDCSWYTYGTQCSEGCDDSCDSCWCISCPTGRYEPSSGSTSCNVCPSGQYQDSGGQTAGCKLCPVGRSESSSASSACDPCSPGR
jgi:hypothetical protein